MLPRSPFLAAAGCAAALATALSLPSSASSHREAPLISQDPLADNTDVYAFVSPASPDKVTLISNFIPLQVPFSGPNFWKFDDNVLYEIMVDNNADAVEDITFQFRFRTETRNLDTFLYNTGQITSLDDADWNVRQFYSVNSRRAHSLPRRRHRRCAAFGHAPSLQSVGRAEGRCPGVARRHGELTPSLRDMAIVAAWSRIE